jgi:predicted ribosome quality control (RQC) complex YloA/Tae2 family protein
MAVCYSVAWEAKVLTTAYWVNSDQVNNTIKNLEAKKNFSIYFN